MHDTKIVLIINVVLLFVECKRTIIYEKISMIHLVIDTIYFYNSSTACDDSNASFTVITMPDIPIWYSHGLLYILGIIHLILAVWMVIEYFILEYQNISLSKAILARVKRKL